MPSSDVTAVAAQFDSIEDTISAFKNGEFIVVLDDLARENEGDLIIAGQDLTPEKMAFMVRHTSGLICAPITPARCTLLALPQMVGNSEDPKRTAYTISIDANHPDTTTGISAHDRALTCNMLASKTVKKEDLRRPGHIIPLKARQGGVRERTGHTEAAVDFCRLAGKEEVGVISELVDDGEIIVGEARHLNPGMMRRDGCLAFGKRWGIKVCTIEDLVVYLEKTEGKLQNGGVNGSNMY